MKYSKYLALLAFISLLFFLGCSEKPSAGKAVSQQPLVTTPKITNFCNISMDSVPQGAAVYIDGKQKGLTPMLVEGVEAGIRNIRMAKEGYEDYSVNLGLLANETYFVRPTLKQKYNSGR